MQREQRFEATALAPGGQGRGRRAPDPIVVVRAHERHGAGGLPPADRLQLSLGEIAAASSRREAPHEGGGAGVFVQEQMLADQRF